MSAPDRLYANAVREVTRDQNAGSDDTMTQAEAIANARNVLRLPGAPYVAGAYPIDDDGSWTAQAYIIVLSVPREVQGTARFYSGTQAIRTYARTRAEFDQRYGMPGGWERAGYDAAAQALAIAYGDRAQYPELGDILGEL